MVRRTDLAMVYALLTGLRYDVLPGCDHPDGGFGGFGAHLSLDLVPIVPALHRKACLVCMSLIFDGVLRHDDHFQVGLVLHWLVLVAHDLRLFALLTLLRQYFGHWSLRWLFHHCWCFRY